MKYEKYLLLGVVYLAAINLLYAQEADSAKKLWGTAKYGRKGFEWQSADEKFLLQIQSRFQFRFSTPQDQDPVNFDDFDTEKKPALKINRARFKVGGHAFQPWIKYYWEYELSQGNLLNYTVNVTKWPWLSVQLGQWKVEYSRERLISSGSQTMVDRSVINRPFTVDRQQGAEIYGRLNGKGAADFNYWLGVFTGTGRGNTTNDDNKFMYFGRLQWNILGENIAFEGSDLDYHEKPAAILAVSGINNRSPYTRFSQSGGGKLEGYETGVAGQYTINQANVETALKYRGLSWPSETHWKEIIDHENAGATNVMFGYYVQAGYFPGQLIKGFPKPLEIAFRHAEFLPNSENNHEGTSESSLAFNWFFHEHRNKLTFETSYFDYYTQALGKASEWRLRLQWDISF